MQERSTQGDSFPPPPPKPFRSVSTVSFLPLRACTTRLFPVTGPLQSQPTATYAMTRSLSGHLPPQSTLPSAQRWKQFAALPDYAPEVLVRDTICLDRPSKVWPQNSIERRRRFQTLVNRYASLTFPCHNARMNHSRSLTKNKSTAITVSYSMVAQILNAKLRHVLAAGRDWQGVLSVDSPC